MKEIKKITCHGTSITSGGGFEWESNKYSMLEKYYSHIDEPKKEYNFSWPGQLKKIISHNIEVLNYGCSGYGNEKIYRDVFDITNSNDFDKESHLFLIELTAIGRTELFLNEINDYVVLNYGHNGNFEKINGFAHRYFYDDDTMIELLKKYEEFFIDYIKYTKNFKNVLNEIQKNLNFFYSYLKLNDINFIIVNEGGETTNEMKTKYNLDIINYQTKSKEFNNSFRYYIEELKLTITDETKGGIMDNHFGYEGNKEIARCVKNHIKQKYII